MDIKNRFDAEVEACGDHRMTNEERRAAFAYFVRGVVSEREACAKVCDELASEYKRLNPYSDSEPLMRSCWEGAGIAIRERSNEQK